MSTTITVTEEVIKLTYSEAQGLPGPQGEQGPRGYPGDITVPVPYLKYDPAASAPTHVEGTTYWDSQDHTLAVMTEVSGTVLQVGQESFLRARNTGALIPDGSVVYVSGATGQRPRVSLARADSESTADTVIGIATADIPTNSDGYVTTFGLVRGINTAAYTEGQMLYLSPTTAGGMTATRPSAPNHAVRVCTVVVAGSNGAVFVSVDAGNHLSRLHDVLVATPASEQVLAWNGTAWANRQGFAGWDDLRFPASSINPPGLVSDPAVDTSESGFTGTLLFSGSADNLIAVAAQMSHEWSAGTAIYPHIHWANPTGTANAVTWELYYRKVGGPGDAPGAWVGPLTATVAAGSPAVSDQTVLSSFPSIDMTGLKESAMILFRLYRRGSTDASSGTARLYEFDIHYLKNKIGTTSELPA